MIKHTAKQNRESKTEKIKRVLIFVLFKFLALSLIIFTMPKKLPTPLTREDFDKLLTEEEKN